MSLLCAIDQVQRGLKGDQRQKDSALIDSTSIYKYTLRLLSASLASAGDDFINRYMQ